MQKVRRLYDQFQPEHYRLLIDTDKHNMKFNGEVVIRGNKTGRPSQRITFHAKQLRIISAKIVRHDKRGDIDMPVVRTLVHKSSDELRIHSQSMLMPGSYSVTIRFEGKITQPMNGIYPCYFESEGQKEVILATQFESHHAREAFPCIDEPEAKAVFSLNLLCDPNETVLSNTPLIKQSQKKGRMLSEFSETPKMSSYLLAFVCGKLSYREGQTAGGVTVRAYATPDNHANTAFALQTTIDCLDFYNDYFAIDYPLSKCDLVALPDFANGAMENWGLITFREHALFVDDQNTSLWVKQYVANVIAHELTHQWFGNLVTMRWWNDLWLNESFATLMSYVAVDHLFPEWQVWTQFVIDEQLPAFRLDSLAHTHPINVSINHPDEIRTIFDTISYEKGASVLLMLMHYIGHDAFRSGLTNYLKRHAYANTESKDLWQAWEETATKPVADFMNAWTTQAGVA